MIDAMTVVAALAVAVVVVFIIDMATRAYLMLSSWHAYKEDQTEDEDASYSEEKEAQALRLLSKSRLTSWIVKGYKNQK